MSAKASILINYLKNIDYELNNKKSYNSLRNKIGSIISKSKSVPQPSNTLPNDSIRNEWNTGSIIEVYSQTQKQWQKGEIININFDKQGEWLKVNYGLNRTKQIQRYSNHLRPTLKPNSDKSKPKKYTNKTKKPKTKTAISIEEIRNKILNILRIYSPNEINSIDKLMKLYKNREHELLYSLCIKYKQTYTKIQPKTLKNAYTIGPKIGSGGFAIVRKCKRKSDNKLFAMKIIEKSKYINAKQLLLLENEINIMRKLSHPNVIKLFDIFENNKKICLILDLCKGKSIFDAIIENNNKGFKECNAKLIFYYLLIALEYIHYNKIVHRDLKIEDLLFRENNKNGSNITIIDFGLCGNLNDNKNGYLNDSVGTPNYVSPEILNKQNYNTKTDMWTAGVILYVILSGYQPFHIEKNENENENQLYDLIKNGKYESMTSIEWFGVSDCAKDLIRKLLNVDPIKRLNATMALRHEWIGYISGISGYIRMEMNNDYLVSFATEIIGRYYA